MRFIPRAGYEPPEQWQTDADGLTTQLNAAGSDIERKNIIDKKPSHWGKIKGELLVLSKGKCWFSEARDVYSHLEVEHFRPKNIIAKNLDSSEREGYWWRSYEWDNFRICGNVGNRKKGNFFPLRSDSIAATSATRNIDDEIYYLLDPCDEDDPDLLSFDMDGKAIPSDHCGEWDKQRVEVTIEKLKLYHEPLEEARREVWDTCNRLINECENLAAKFHTNPSATKRQRIRDIRNELRKMIGFSAEFSRVAIACLENSKTATSRKILTPT
ncbi:MAG: hypothetical protein KKB30_03605 [Proteobacteria bacterium]|nr:hypothetical protein [Pseudomonadota bacterium]MBU1714507.1 hypothetical protein [Pseudomonadota bacterium]